jgi:hypothetical protein
MDDEAIQELLHKYSEAQETKTDEKLFMMLKEHGFAFSLCADTMLNWINLSVLKERDYPSLVSDFFDIFYFEERKKN